MRILIKEAMKKRNARRGVRILQKDLGKLLWPDSDPLVQQVKINRLCNGLYKQIRPEWVKLLCGALGVDANFLFGIESNIIES